MYIKNKKGLKMDLCITPAQILSKDKHSPFKTTLSVACEVL